LIHYHLLDAIADRVNVPVWDEALAGVESLKGGIHKGTKVAPVYRVREFSVDLHGVSRSILFKGLEETWTEALEDLEFVAFDRYARVQGKQRCRSSDVPLERFRHQRLD